MDSLWIHGFIKTTRSRKTSKTIATLAKFLTFKNFHVMWNDDSHPRGCCDGTITENNFAFQKYFPTN
jgi:hypothetical protein